MAENDKGIITDIQHFSIHDGPGIRTTVFLKGCPLKCQWCHNPECISFNPEIVFNDAFCIRCNACVDACSHGCHFFDAQAKGFNREACRLDQSCLDHCWAAALELKGRSVLARDVMKEVNEDRIFYDNTGGGVTISGGEPLAQGAFTKSLLTLAKKGDLHTVVDTSGLGKWETVAGLLDDTDLFLYDIKCHDPGLHKKLTGVDNSIILSNLEKLLKSGADVILRIPLIQGLNDQEEEMEALCQRLYDLRPGLRVHLLPYHKFGEQKYEYLGLDYTLSGPAPPEPFTLRKLADIAKAYHLDPTIKGMEKSQA